MYLQSFSDHLHEKVTCEIGVINIRISFANKKLSILCNFNFLVTIVELF